MKSKIRWLWTTIAFLLLLTPATAAKLTWDSNADADYYIVYRGTTSGNYDWSSNQIYAPTVELDIESLDLAPGTYYFSIKAFNSCGNSSDFSDEIPHTVVELDSDSDGIPDEEEYILGTNPFLEDSDFDTIRDYDELYLSHTDPTLLDSNNDGIEDGQQDWTTDTDGDGTRDIVDFDVDGDGDTNQEEVENGSDPFFDNTFDIDEDGLSNGLEFIIGTDPFIKDTDRDGIEDGDQYLNDPEADNDGDGILDPADLDDDNDGDSDEYENAVGTDQYYNEKYGYVDTLIIDGTIYLLKTDVSSKKPTIVSFTETNEDSLTKNYQISFSDENHWAIGYSGDLGNLDGKDGNEVAVWIRDKTTNQDSIIIIDILTGEVYNSGTTTTPADTLCELEDIDIAYFNNGNLAELGFCTATNQTVVRVYSEGTSQYIFVKDLYFLDTGVHALSIEIKDINSDGEEEIIVTPKLVSENREIKKVTGATIVLVKQ